ncbi:MAG TPA: hypothetical protein VKG61_08140 [Streptosporangiaceae bacterium]|nr:hypothetical protein [Streptosporangiaceae bacterium]
MRDRGTGRSLTPLPSRQDRVLGPAPADLLLVGRGARVVLMGLVPPVVLVPRRLAGRVELVLVGRGDRVELMGLVVLARRLALVVLHLADRVEPGPVDRELPDLMGRVDLGDLASRVVLVPMGPVDLAAPADLDQTGRAAPADRVELTSRVGLVDRAGLADLVQTGRAAPADLAAPAVPDLTGRVDLAGRAAPVDRHRRRTSNTVSTTGVAPRWAAPGTCRTGSARRITGRRPRPGNADSAGTVGLPPVLRRLSGTDHHLQVAGAGLRLPVVGTAHGTGRRAMSQSRSVITGRLVTTGTTRSRCSTRYSVDGASGSSVSGSRCTDLTAPSGDYLSSSTH